MGPQLEEASKQSTSEYNRKMTELNYHSQAFFLEEIRNEPAASEVPKPATEITTPAFKLKTKEEVRHCGVAWVIS